MRISIPSIRPAETDQLRIKQTAFAYILYI